jgi:hypothetical protein
VSGVSGGATKDYVRYTARAVPSERRGEAVAEVDSRARDDPAILGETVGMLKHCHGGFHKRVPLLLHLSELVVCVSGLKLSGVAQSRYYCAASNIKVVRITITFEGGPEGSTRVHAGVQVHDVGENITKSGNKCFLGWECKERNVIRKAINYTKHIFGFPRPGLLE